MRHLVILLLALGLLTGVGQAGPDHEVVIGPETVSPHFAAVKTGERVDFRNQASASVHIEFGADPRQHEVVQVPVTGPIWAVFHRPGTHPYVVHVGTGKGMRTLHGVVDVSEDETHRWDSKTCGVVVEGECLDR